MAAHLRWFIIILSLLVLRLSTGCQKKTDIDITLPAYEKKMVLECYLEVGRPIQLALTESASYFEKPELVPIYDATVTIKYKNNTDTLKNIVYFDKVHVKGFNYTSKFVVPEDYDNVFYISIKAKDGRAANAQTRMQRRIPISSIKPVSQGDGDNIKIAFEDDLSTRDYYRVLFLKDSLHTIPQVDLLITDELYGTQEIDIQPQVKYKANDTVIVELYHINEDYYNYLESVKNAITANFDPLTRPTPVKSNVNGALGIFTAFAVSRDTIILKK